MPIRALPLLFLMAAASMQAQNTAATFGTVITLGGTPSDIVLDETRHQAYLVNSAANRIDILNTATNTVAGSISVGVGPLAAAMSMDATTLYVTNGTERSLSVVDLNARFVTQTVSMPATPQGVEVGADGRALIATVGTGTAAAPANTLLIFDKNQPSASALTAVSVPAAPTTPPPLPTTTLTRPDTTFTGKLVRTPNGQYIVGLTVPAAAPTTTYLFVYEVSSGSILRSRTVTGQSTVLSMSPDGSRFMAGYTLYDVASLSILGQMNNANAPFPSTAVFSTRQNVGGSVFSPDGTTVYGAFNVATFTNPPPPSNSSTLLVSDPANLAIRLGIRMPESIVAKMIISSDGTSAWALSASGVLYLPLGNLYKYPILMPSTTQIFLSQNPCNPGLAQGTVQVSNLGTGKLTFAVTTISSALTSSVSSGVAPSTITFTMEPGRLNVVRQPGTNLVTGAVTLQGQPLDVSLASNEAINIPPVIRVYMNYRSSDQRGIIFPIQVTPNNSPTANTITTTTTLIGGDQGLEDIVLDQTRNRVYISNAGYNRVEVFDTVNQVFLPAIPVGQLPHQMALSTDGNTLYVASNGGELIDMVDLTINKDIGHVNFPPLPRQAGGVTATLLYPQALAVANSGLEFLMSNGGQWKVIAGTAVPRPADVITRPTPTATNNLIATPTAATMQASQDNARILTLSGNGTAFLYDASTDAYIASAGLFGTNNTAIQSFYGPLSAGPFQTWYALGGLYTNPSLTVLGGSANPSQSTGAQRNIVATAAWDQSNFLRLSIPVRANLTTTPTSDARPTIELVNIDTNTSRLLAVAPENPRFTLLGTTRYNIPPRSMVVDKNNVAYIISISGLSVVPLTPSGAPVPQIAANNRGVLNANDGSTTLRIGGVININGSNLASASTASQLPPPTVLGGSCVTFNDVPLPLLSASPGQIQAQIPPTVTTGTNVVQVRSLGTGQQSASVTVTVQAASGTGGSTNSGSVPVGEGRNNNRLLPQ
jgi:YVTN family beta-propeller protein